MKTADAIMDPGTAVPQGYDAVITDEVLPAMNVRDALMDCSELVRTGDCLAVFFDF